MMPKQPSILLGSCLWVAVSALLAGAACSGEPTGSDARVLVGQWGSPEAELIGLHSGAELRVPCRTIIIDDPIVLSDADGFTTRARVQGSGLTIGTLPVVRLTGQVAGDRVTIDVPAASPASAATYVLEAGVTRDPEDVPMCPQ
jgi:hypothetical protein